MSKQGEYAAALSAVGAVVVGYAGCVSCMDHAVKIHAGDFPFTLFNLITGLFVGAAGGAVVGAAIGYFKDVKLREISEWQQREAERIAAAAARAAALNPMMKLFRDMHHRLTAPMTELQRDDLLRTYIGREFDLVGSIHNITSHSIWFTSTELQVLEKGTEWRHPSITLRHGGDKLRAQLLQYENGDHVNLMARLTDVYFGETARYDFDLLSIKRV